MSENVAALEVVEERAHGDEDGETSDSSRALI
jgi:hypothetical protein